MLCATAVRHRCHRKGQQEVRPGPSSEYRRQTHEGSTDGRPRRLDGKSTKGVPTAILIVVAVFSRQKREGSPSALSSEYRRQKDEGNTDGPPRSTDSHLRSKTIKGMPTAILFVVVFSRQKHEGSPFAPSSEYRRQKDGVPTAVLMLLLSRQKHEGRTDGRPRRTDGKSMKAAPTTVLILSSFVFSWPHRRGLFLQNRGSHQKRK